MEIPRLSDGVVTLREPRPEDVEPCWRACQDPENHRWLSALPWPYLREHAEAFLGEILPRGWTDGSGWSWVLGDAAAAGEPLAGVLGFHDIRPDDGIVEVGYWVAPWARGRGLATAAVRLACRWAIEQRQVGRIEWLAAVGNEASRRVAEKAGFIPEGILRSRVVRHSDGHRSDAWVGSLLPSDLRPRRA